MSSLIGQYAVGKLELSYTRQPSWARFEGLLYTPVNCLETLCTVQNASVLLCTTVWKYLLQDQEKVYFQSFYNSFQVLLFRLIVKSYNEVLANNK